MYFYFCYTTITYGKYNDWFHNHLYVNDYMLCTALPFIFNKRSQWDEHTDERCTICSLWQLNIKHLKGSSSLVHWMFVYEHILCWKPYLYLKQCRAYRKYLDLNSQLFSKYLNDAHKKSFFITQKLVFADAASDMCFLFFCSPCT